MKKAPKPIISFGRNHPNLHLLIENYKKNQNINIPELVKNGSMIEFEKWLFVSTDELQERKNKLESWYKSVGWIIKNSNNLHNELESRYKVIVQNLQHLDKNHISQYEEIKTYCHNATIGIEPFVKKYFNNSNSESFIMICLFIINQPLYFIEAIKTHYEGLTEHQKTYYRYGYLEGKFNKGRNWITGHSLGNIIRKEIANNEKETITKVFLFMETFIVVLKTVCPVHFDYYKSPLFRVLFSEIMKFKGYYLEAFGTFNFANILEIEQQLVPAPIIKGLDCKLSPETIENIHFQMVDKKCIKADLKDFQAIFSKVVREFNPIIWLLNNQKGEANKTALYVFLKQMLGNVSNDVLKKEVPVFFRDGKGQTFIINRPNKSDQNYSAIHFKGIFQIKKTLPIK